MNDKNINCGRDCRNTCAMLNEALRKETSSVRFYESVFEECNTPEVRNFLSDIIDARRQEILKIIQKLNEIHARSQSLDGLAASFN